MKNSVKNSLRNIPDKNEKNKKRTKNLGSRPPRVHVSEPSKIKTKMTDKFDVGTKCQVIDDGYEGTIVSNAKGWYKLSGRDKNYRGKSLKKVDEETIETIENATIENATIDNATIDNATVDNATVDNATIDNDEDYDEDSDEDSDEEHEEHEEQEELEEHEEHEEDPGEESEDELLGPHLNDTEAIDNYSDDEEDDEEDFDEYIKKVLREQISSKKTLRAHSVAYINDFLRKLSIVFAREYKNFKENVSKYNFNLALDKDEVLKKVLENELLYYTALEAKKEKELISTKVVKKFFKYEVEKDVLIYFTAAIEHLALEVLEVSDMYTKKKFISKEDIIEIITKEDAELYNLFKKLKMI